MVAKTNHGGVRNCSLAVPFVTQLLTNVTYNRQRIER